MIYLAARELDRTGLARILPSGDGDYDAYKVYVGPKIGPMFWRWPRVMIRASKMLSAFSMHGPVRRDHTISSLIGPCMLSQ